MERDHDDFEGETGEKKHSKRAKRFQVKEKERKRPEENELPDPASRVRKRQDDFEEDINMTDFEDNDDFIDDDDDLLDEEDDLDFEDDDDDDDDFAYDDSDR